MKRGGWFINTHRPRAMVNYPDLCTALRSGHLRSAMLGALAGPPPPVPAAPAPQRHLTRASPAPRRPPVRIAAAMVAEEIRRWRAG
ncbi:MAG: hypothetical protein R3D25_14450 [Geminicoccaceae bacterium]